MGECKSEEKAEREIIIFLQEGNSEERAEREMGEGVRMKKGYKGNGGGSKNEDRAEREWESE